MLSAQVYKDILTPALVQVASVATAKANLPILANVLMEADGGFLRVSATDMETSLRVSLPAEVASPGAMALPAKKLAELAKLMSKADVALDETAPPREAEPGVMTIKSGAFKTELRGADPADFPALPPTEGVGFAEVEGDDLALALARTAMASNAKDNGRYNLTGVYLERVDTEGAEPFLRFVATDGHRVHMGDCKAKNMEALDLPHGVILPKKGVDTLKKMALSASAANVKVRLGMANGSVVADTGNATATVRLMEGTFPDYRRVLPKDNDKAYAIDRKALTNCLKLMSVFSDDMGEASQVTVLDFRPDNVLYLSAASREVGTAGEQTPFKGDPAGGLRTAFNASYLMDFMSSLRGDEVTFRLKEPLAPLLVTSEGDPGYTGIIMAMNLPEDRVIKREPDTESEGADDEAPDYPDDYPADEADDVQG